MTLWPRSAGRTRSPVRFVPLACALVGVASCVAPAEDGALEVVVTDSAGVVIVETRGDAATIPGVVLGDAPLVRVGSEDAAAPDFFASVQAAHLDPRGDLWVVDGMSAEVKVFQVPSGRHRFTVGGSGEGPGEFRRPALVGFDDARAWVWDHALARLTVLSLDGDLLETRRVGVGGEHVPRLLLRTGRGTFLAQRPQTFGGAVTDGMTIQDTVRVWELDLDSDDAELVGERRGVTWYFARGMQVPVPFAYGSRFGVGALGVVFTDPDGYPTLDVVQEGVLVRRMRVVRERARVTSEMAEGELASPIRSEAGRAILEEHAGRYRVPAFAPTWEWVRVGADGHVFALRFGTLMRDEVWDVFDPDGGWTGTVTLRDTAHLMDAAGGRLVVVETPDVRGPTVAVYRWGGAG